MRGYDKISYNDQMLLDLPFYEGRAVLTRDQAKPHHQDLNMNDPGGGSFAWERIQTGFFAFGPGFDEASIDSGLDFSFTNGFDWGFDSGIGMGVLTFATVGGGAGDGVYIDCSLANCVDLNFTTGDYSIGVWINWIWNGTSSIIIGKYEVNVSGWEIYLDISGGRNTVSQRHSHSSIVGDTNTNCYSVGWTPGVWAFLGISRTGGSLYPVHHRNGIALTMSYEVTGMFDPDLCANKDLVIGTRYSKDMNWYRGQMWRPRVWNRALSALEWLDIFEEERDFFGV